MLYTKSGHNNIKDKLVKKRINFEVSNPIQLRDRVITYFTQSGFKSANTNDEVLLFTHSGSVFDAWKSDPLKWGSEITVLLEGEKIVADFLVDTDGHLNTVEQTNVWVVFINNFKLFLTSDIDFKTENEKAVKLVKSSTAGYLGWIILGFAAGVLIEVLFFKLTGYKMGVVIVPIIATIFLNNRISYKKSRNALQ